MERDIVATFVDMQDEINPLNGKSDRSYADVAAGFAEMECCEPSFYILDGENGYSLTMGFSKAIGCVQSSRTNDEPHYLMAAADERDWIGNDFEFLTADTPTPVSPKHCLPISEVRRIVVHFVITGKRLDFIHWEEV